VVDGIEGSHEGSPVGKRMQRHEIWREPIALTSNNSKMVQDGAIVAMANQ